MLSAVRPQTGPSLVWTVVPAVPDGRACAATGAGPAAAAPGGAAAEPPPTAATVSPATRAAAAAANATTRSGCLLPRAGTVLILFHVIVNPPGFFPGPSPSAGLHPLLV